MFARFLVVSCLVRDMLAGCSIQRGIRILGEQVAKEKGHDKCDDHECHRHRKASPIVVRRACREQEGAVWQKKTKRQQGVSERKAEREGDRGDAQMDAQLPSALTMACTIARFSDGCGTALDTQMLTRGPGHEPHLSLVASLCFARSTHKPRRRRPRQSRGERSGRCC